MAPGRARAARFYPNTTAQDLYGQRPDPVRDARSAKKGEVSSHSGILLLDPITYNINQKKTPIYKYVYAQRCLAHARGGAR